MRIRTIYQVGATETYTRIPDSSDSSGRPDR
jgi:hypothetical protein